MMRFLLIGSILIADRCSGQEPILVTEPGEEIRCTYFNDGRIREMFTVRRYTIVDTFMVQQIEPPYEIEIVTDTVEREFMVRDYLEFYPNGSLKVRGNYGYEYGGYYKDGLWIHLSEFGDTLKIERYTRDLPSNSLERLDIKLHH